MLAPIVFTIEEDNERKGTSLHLRTCRGRLLEGIRSYRGPVTPRKAGEPGLSTVSICGVCGNIGNRTLPDDRNSGSFGAVKVPRTDFPGRPLAYPVPG